MDIARITVSGGKGGDGAVAFHREKYVNAGGPDGGDGGKGGSVIFQASNHLSTLIDFRYKRKYEAQSGMPGTGSTRDGKKGQDLIIRVPKGTILRDAETGKVVADLSDDEPLVIAKGGKGGWGNTHFATPTRQIPRFAKGGLPGEYRELIMELKLLADVGLIGFPNVGKSTLISVVSNARPKIDNYHFTTITPSLGVVRVDEGNSFVMADIPGLIEGAAEGKGKGHAFLRHVERCRLLVHVVDISGSEARDPMEDFNTINQELTRFDAEMAKRPQIVVGNKKDIATPEQIQWFADQIAELGLPFFLISAATHQGTEALVGAIAKALADLPPVLIYEPEVEEIAPTKRKREFSITKNEEGSYLIDAPWLKQVLTNVNMDDYESLQYFQRQLVTSGIIAKLVEMGINDGDPVVIDDFIFDYLH